MNREYSGTPYNFGNSETQKHEKKPRNSELEFRNDQILQSFQKLK